MQSHGRLYLNVVLREVPKVQMFVGQGDEIDIHGDRRRG